VCGFGALGKARRARTNPSMFRKTFFRCLPCVGQHSALPTASLHPGRPLWGMAAAPIGKATSWTRAAVTRMRRFRTFAGRAEADATGIAVVCRRYAGRPDQQHVVASVDDGMIRSESRSRRRSANERDARQHVRRSPATPAPRRIDYSRRIGFAPSILRCTLEPCSGRSLMEPSAFPDAKLLNISSLLKQSPSYEELNPAAMRLIIAAMSHEPD
jgi:hypothetical protein